jgi:hypothetical protein
MKKLQYNYTFRTIFIFGVLIVYAIGSMFFHRYDLGAFFLICTLLMIYMEVCLAIEYESEDV